MPLSWRATGTRRRRPLAATTVLDVVSCGRPLPGHEVRVVDAHEREVPARTEGRIEFRGPSATTGYYRNPAASARLVHGDWLDTGDVGYVSGGELFLTSRAKDLIKRGGHTIHPYDLEAAIGDVAGVRKGCVAVFGTADRARGTERVIVVAETNQTDRTLRQTLHERLARLAATHLDGPADEVLLVAPRTLLKTSSGKIRRTACRELYERGMLKAPRRAVWLQLGALVARAVAAKLRRAVSFAARMAYAVHAWLMLLLVAGVSLPLLVLARSVRARFAVAHRAAAALVRLCRIPLATDGLEHLPADRPAVIVVNHASYLDGLVLLAVLGSEARFAAKRELAQSPLLGRVLRRLGTYFVDRIDPAGGIEDTRELTTAVGRGERVIFFPEGTLSRAPGLAQFHLGAFAVSAATGTPVVPIVLLERAPFCAIRSGFRSAIRSRSACCRP